MRLQFLLVLLGGLVAGKAASFEDANRHYEKGDYDAAAAGYREQLKTGRVSPALYFNLGNALFQGGDFGKGIWCYRQAKRLAPRDPDIRANLRFSRKEVAGAFAPEEVGWRTVFQNLSQVEWKWFAALGLGVLFALLAVREYLRANAGGLAWPIRIFALIAPIAVALSWVGHRAWDGSQEAVVVVEKLDARYGPLEDSKAAYQLVDGEEVIIADQKDEWLQIVNTSGQSGWVPATSLLRLNDQLPD